MYMALVSYGRFYQRESFTLAVQRASLLFRLFCEHKVDVLFFVYDPSGTDESVGTTTDPQMRITSSKSLLYCI